VIADIIGRGHVTPCASAGGDSMFPEPNQRAETAYAKRLCEGCEIRTECLDYALTNGEESGIWGGLSPADRKNLLKDRRREAAGQTGDLVPLEKPRIQDSDAQRAA
jgi:hypothetical protein